MPQMLVCYFKVTRQAQSTLFQRDFETDIRDVMNPDETRVVRYGRAWRFAQPKVEDGYLYGKLGYQTPGTETKPFYDVEKHDYLKQTTETALVDFVLYALELKRQIIAFEIKPPDIKYHSFRGAFERFLAIRSELGLEIEDFLETSQFKAWASEMKRITVFKATLRLPNPNWSKVPIKIQEFIRKTKADRGKVELTKGKGSEDGLDIDNTIIEDAVTYGEYGYSDIFARGEKGGRAITFDSRRDSPSDQVEINKDSPEEVKAKAIKDMLDKFIERKYKNEK